MVPKCFKFNNSQIGLIFGLGGIGHSLYHQLKQQYPDIKLIGVTTNPLHGSQDIIVLKNYTEKEIHKLCETLVTVDFIINTVGSLNAQTKKPEKSLRDFDAESLTKTIEINTALTGFIAKHFYRKFPKESPALFSSLSALVGSISQNELGGWYSYRISKAALNMLIKNISLEVKRTRPELIVNAVHPGTTETNLSKDYLKGINHPILTPDQCAQRLINFYQSVSPEHSGFLFHANGEKVPF